MIKTLDLFDLEHTLAKEELQKYDYPWEIIPHIKEMILSLARNLPAEYQEIQPQVWVHNSARLASSVCLQGPCIIGKNCEIRQAAFLRGAVLAGEACVIGNSVELKNTILFDQVQVPHFNYVGDSILGYKAHFGAGAITSNIKSDRRLIVLKNGKETIETGLQKLGALCGDFVEIGCNSVLNPGTVIGKNSQIYPLTSLRGVIPADSIVKSGQFEVIAKRKD